MQGLDVCVNVVLCNNKTHEQKQPHKTKTNDSSLKAAGGTDARVNYKVFL